MPPPLRITIYGKPDCCLCDRALEVLEAFAHEHPRPVEIAKIDITSDPALVARYGTRIPVVTIDGVECFEYKVGPLKLKRLVADLEARGAADATGAGSPASGP